MEQVFLADSLSLRSGMNKTALFAGGSLKLPFINFDFGMSNDLSDSLGTRYSFSTRLGRGSLFSNYRKRYALYKQKAYAEFALGGNLKQGKSEVSLLGGYKIGSNDLLNLINMANKDDSCKGYIIRVGNLSSSLTGVGLVEEIRTELLKAKAGKRVFVYFEGHIGLQEYYLASIVDIVIMPPMGTLAQFGLNFEVTKASSFLEKLGIAQETIQSGEQKASTAPFSADLSSLDRYQLSSVIEELFQHVVSDIEKARPEAVDGIEQISDGSLITAREAKEIGLVDRLAYWPDV